MLFDMRRLWHPTLLFQLSNCVQAASVLKTGRAPYDALMAAKFAQVTHRADDVVPTQYALEFIACHNWQLVHAIAIHLSKSVHQFSVRPYTLHLRNRNHDLVSLIVGQSGVGMALTFCKVSKPTTLSFCFDHQSTATATQGMIRDQLLQSGIRTDRDVVRASHPPHGGQPAVMDSLLADL